MKTCDVYDDCIVVAGDKGEVTISFQQLCVINGSIAKIVKAREDAEVPTCA